MVVRSMLVLSIMFSFGCASSRLMPRYIESSVVGREYDNVLRFYDAIKTHKMTVRDVREVTGIDLNNGQDITILGPTYIRNFFMKNSLIRVDYLPPSVQFCIKWNGCVGYLIVKQHKSREGVGRFMPRWLRFKRQDIVREWRVEILILAVRKSGRIIYKEILSALPEQVEIKTKRNPLGPFQNLFGDVQYKYKF